MSVMGVIMIDNEFLILKNTIELKKVNFNSNGDIYILASPEHTACT